MTKGRRLVFLLAALVAVGGAAFGLADAAEAQSFALPADVGDLSNASTIEVKDSAATVVLLGRFVEQPEDDDDVERKAELQGSGATASATGAAEVEVSRNGNELDQEVELSVTNLTPAATYAIVVDGKQLASFQANKEGKAEIELSSTK